MIEERFRILENKATEIRKILFGALILTKDIWKDTLEQTQEGLKIMKTIEEAEEVFINSSITDRIEKIEDILDVIHKRARGIFTLLEYISKDKQKT